MAVRWEKSFERHGKRYVIFAELPFSEDPNYLEISVHEAAPRRSAGPQGSETIGLAKVVYPGGLEGYPVTGVNFRTPVGDEHHAVAEDLMIRAEAEFCRLLDGAVEAPSRALRLVDRDNGAIEGAPPSN